jgi:hypothetical protein
MEILLDYFWPRSLRMASLRLKRKISLLERTSIVVANFTNKLHNRIVITKTIIKAISRDKSVFVRDLFCVLS